MSHHQWDSLTALGVPTPMADDAQALAALLSGFQGDVPMCRRLHDGALLFAWYSGEHWLLVLRRTSEPQQNRAPAQHATLTPQMRFRAALQRRWRRAAALDQAHLALSRDGEVVALYRIAATAVQQMLAHPGSAQDALNAVLTPLRKLLDES
jgi:hypothetical protein